MEALKPTPAPSGPGDSGDLVIKVKGVDDLLVYRAKCCNPIRGEGIVGYVTRGKGIAVHSKNCANVQNLMYEVERKIDVEWARAVTETFPVRVVVHTDDRPGMLNQLTSVLFAEPVSYTHLRYALEQTVIVRRDTLARRENAPIEILQGLCGRQLA